MILTVYKDGVEAKIASNRLSRYKQMGWTVEKTEVKEVTEPKKAEKPAQDKKAVLGNPLSQKAK